MNDLEMSIIIQKELDLCNKKIKLYDQKYNPEKKEQIQKIYNYLIEQYEEHTDEFHKKILLDDMHILKIYMDEFE